VDEDLERRKRMRRTAFLLALVALSFYAGFILLSVIRSRA
jgi:uncharacterized membrane protein (DUF485 family)